MDIPFYNRNEELAKLVQLFRDEILAGRSFTCAISGQKNAGKTALIQKFVNRLQEDLDISSQLHNFNKSRHVIEFQCTLKSQTEPYGSFLSITQQILTNDKYKLVLSKILGLLMSLAGISTVTDAFNTLVLLAKTIKTDGEQENTQLEIKKFKTYKAFLKRLTRKAPVIFVIKDAQYLDIHSLKLIESILRNSSGFVGAFILEMDENQGECDDAVIGIYNLIKEGKIEKIHLYPLDPDFPALMMAPVFGSDFLNSGENDLLFSVSKGLPGNLVELLREFIHSKWIYEKDGRWHKVPEFKEKFLPKEQQLIELLIPYFSDGIIHESEMEIVKKMAHNWGLSHDYINFCIKMLTSIASLGYRFVKTLPWGFLSEFVFQVELPDKKHMIVEYLPTTDSALPLKHDKVLKNDNLVEATTIKQFEDGILVEWNFSEGKRMREILLKRKSLHLDKCLKLVTEVIQGLRELHKYNIIHTYITPEAVIESKDGTYMLATLDLDILSFIRGYGRRLYSDSIYYSAPELLGDGKPSVRSDIYSLGMLLYRLITNTLPFIDLNPKRAKEQITGGKLNLTELKAFTNPEALNEFFRICLSKNPSDRFSNLDEFLNGLQRIRDGLSHTKRPQTSENEPEKKKFVSTTSPAIKYAVRTAIFLIFLTACIVAYNYYNDLKSLVTKTKEIGQVVVEVVPGGQDFSTESPMIHEEIEFLIQDNLMRCGNVASINSSEYRILKESDDGIQYVPKLYVRGELNRSRAGYELKIEFVGSGNKIKDTIVMFNEPVTFLQEVLPSITGSIFAMKKVRMINKKPLTSSWDAYTSYLKGKRAWNKLDKTVAKSEFERSLEYDPGFTLARLGLLEVLKFEGGNSVVIDSLISGLKKNMGNLGYVDSVRVLAVEHSVKGMFLQSVDFYKKIAEKLPYDKFSFYEIAEAYYELADNDNAIEYYNKALKIDPDFTLALNHLGYSLLNKYKAGEALVKFRRCVELDSSANSFDSMGDGFFAAGMIDSAIIYKQKGMTIDPSLEYLHSWTGLLFALKGDREKAAASFAVYNSLIKGNEGLEMNGLFYQAVNHFLSGEIRVAESLIDKSLAVISKYPVVIGYQENYWLKGVISFHLGDSSALKNIISEFAKIIDKNKFSKTTYHPVYKYYVHLNILSGVLGSDNEKLRKYLNILDTDIIEKVKDHGSVFDYGFINYHLFKVYSSKKYENYDKAQFFKRKAESGNSFYKVLTPEIHMF